MFQQIGNYVVEFTDGLTGFGPIKSWGVRMAGDEEYISDHATKKEAIAAVKRYQAGDKRRAG